jgi:hypothetical protein
MSLFTPPNVRATDANNVALSGAKWYFYLTTTTTPTPVYTTSARNVAHANPVVADSAGKFASIYLDPAVVYRAVLKTSAGATLYDVDPFDQSVTQADLGDEGTPNLINWSRPAAPVNGTLGNFYNLQPFYPEETQFAGGAVADGTDQNTALNACFEAARLAGGAVILTQQYGNGATPILIRTGVKAVLCMDGAGIVATAPLDAQVLVAGKAWSASYDNPDSIRIDGLSVDMNGFAGNGLKAHNPSHLQIRRFKLRNGKNYGILIRNYHYSGGQDASDVLIEDPDIELRDPADDALQEDSGISIDTDTETGTAGPVWKQFLVDGIGTGLLTSTYRAKRIRIVRPRIFGGRYGIFMGWCDDSSIEDPYVTNNTRNLVFEHDLNRINVFGGQFRESVSAALHCAYGARDIQFHAPDVLSTRASIEALLQAYVACTNVTFDRPKVMSSGTPKFFAHIGAHSNNSSIIGGDFEGTVARAGLTAESAWNVAAAGATTHGYGNDPDTVNGFAKVALTGVRFLRNRIKLSSAKPAIQLVQAVDSVNGSVPLRDWKVNGNEVEGTTCSEQLNLIEQTSGELSGGTLNDNPFETTATVSDFVLPRGRLHFVSARGNAVLNEELFGSTTSNVANIIAGAIGTVSVTVTGAVVGDYVEDISTSAAIDAGLIMSGEVTAADTVTIKLHNTTAGGIDPASMTYYAKVRRRLG